MMIVDSSELASEAVHLITSKHHTPTRGAVRLARGQHGHGHFKASTLAAACFCVAGRQSILHARLSGPMWARTVGSTMREKRSE